MIETRVKHAQRWIRYKVLTNGRTLKKGDKFFIDNEGRLVCEAGLGWLNASEWKKLSNKITADIEWYKDKVETLANELKHYERILKGFKNV